MIIFSGTIFVWDFNNIIFFSCKQIVKGIDALTREQMVQIMAFLGIQNAIPVFSMVPAFVPIKPAALVPSVTEEDRVILNNVQKVVQFLTAGTASNQVFQFYSMTSYLQGRIK